MLSSPALTATALLGVALIVVGEVIEIALVIAGPSEIWIWAHWIHTLAAHSASTSTSARLNGVIEGTNSLSELVTFVSELANSTSA